MAGAVTFVSITNYVHVFVMLSGKSIKLFDRLGHAGRQILSRRVVYKEFTATILVCVMQCALILYKKTK